MINNFSFIADTAGERIDALLARNVENLSRSAAQRLLEQGDVLVNGQSIQKKSIREVREDMLAYIPQDRLTYGVTAAPSNCRNSRLSSSSGPSSSFRR